MTRDSAARCSRALRRKSSAATGTPVWLADEPCPTPAISLLVRQRGAAGGIMITASHNPYRWNGVKYKASYGSSGSAGDCRPDRKRTGGCTQEQYNHVASAPGFNPFIGRTHAVSGNDRQAGRLGTPARSEIPFCGRPDARIRCGSTARTFPPPRDRVRRNSRNVRSAFWRRESRAD